MGGPDYNPAGTYRKQVQVPWTPDDGPIFLCIGAVTSAVYVYVNGAKVGYSQDSKLPAEFEISEHVRPGAPLLIALHVVCWCDGAYLEDQDDHAARATKDSAARPTRESTIGDRVACWRSFNKGDGPKAPWKQGKKARRGRKEEGKGNTGRKGRKEKKGVKGGKGSKGKKEGRPGKGK